MSDQIRMDYASVEDASYRLKQVSEEISYHIQVIESVRQNLIDDGNSGAWLDALLRDLEILIAEFSRLQAKTGEISTDLTSATEQFMEASESASSMFGDSDKAIDSKSSNVHFRLYSPPKASPGARNAIYTYAYVEDFLSEVEADVEKFKSELGGEVPSPKKAKQTASIKPETPITVVPESDELDFEPHSLTKTWHGDWTRFGFEFRPNTSLIDETVFIRLSIQISGVEIAHIKCAVEVVDDRVSEADRSVLNENPLAQQKFESKTTTTYQRIFISYSRRDTQIARSYKLAQTALGNDVFLDVDNLRAGENWQAGLAKAIDRADIFQLFWSEHSAESQYCRYEWEYALGHRCPDTHCEAFIRPVYWAKPMPKVPDQLRKLNFKFVPFGDESET